MNLNNAMLKGAHPCTKARPHRAPLPLERVKISHRRRNSGCFLVIALLWLSASFTLAQRPITGPVKGFRFPDYYGAESSAPNRMKSLLMSQEAIPMTNGTGQVSLSAGPTPCCVHWHWMERRERLTSPRRTSTAFNRGLVMRQRVLSPCGAA